MSDLDQKEQNHVRAALRHLRYRLGTWQAVAKALNVSQRGLDYAISGREREITASTAFRVARLLGVMVDDLLVGKFLPPGACPNCGHVIASDFKDESTIVEDAARSGLRLIP